MKIGIKLIKINKKPIERKARIDVFIKSKSIPSFNKSPITLRGIPYLISGVAMASDNFGFLLPSKNPKIKKGIMLIKSE